MLKFLGCAGREHDESRRRVLGALSSSVTGLGLGALGGLVQPALGEQLRQSDKQILLLWLDGGMSQLESWDPKPNTPYGGPFRSIPTSLPGVHISELMPRTARVMQHLAVVRTMQTEDPNHSSGVPKILRGHPINRGVVYPYWGSAVARLLGPTASGLPPYVWVKPGNGGFISKHSGFLGAKYGALALGDGKPPTNLIRPDSLSEQDATERRDLQRIFNQRYVQNRGKRNNDANSFVYDVAEKLMRHRKLFDESTLPEKDRDRYGRHDFGRHTLLARNLLEAGVRFVQVTSYGWDSHGDNFNAHATRVPRVDEAFSSLIEDLVERDMMDRVLVVMMAEFGRTPRINGSVGRDHWPNAWSLAMAGSGIQRGLVLGQTRRDGTDVDTQPFDIGSLFHTWYRAVGVDSQHTEFMNGAQPLPIANDKMEPIKDLLS